MAWLGSVAGACYSSLWCAEGEERTKLRSALTARAPCLERVYAALPDAMCSVVDLFLCALLGSLLGSLVFLSLNALAPSLVVTAVGAMGANLPRAVLAARAKAALVAVDASLRATRQTAAAQSQ